MARVHTQRSTAAGVAFASRKAGSTTRALRLAPRGGPHRSKPAAAASPPCFASSSSIASSSACRVACAAEGACARRVSAAPAGAQQRRGAASSFWESCESERTLRVTLGLLLPAATTAPSRTITQLRSRRAHASALRSSQQRKHGARRRTQQGPPSGPARASPAVHARVSTDAAACRRERARLKQREPHEAFVRRRPRVRGAGGAIGRRLRRRHARAGDPGP